MVNILIANFNYVFYDLSVPFLVKAFHLNHVKKFKVSLICSIPEETIKIMSPTWHRFRESQLQKGWNRNQIAKKPTLVYLSTEIAKFKAFDFFQTTFPEMFREIDSLDSNRNN